MKMKTAWQITPWPSGEELIENDKMRVEAERLYHTFR
jgi:hypothetical protein